MQRALYTAAAGMSARQTTINTIANNLANTGTTGYKRRSAQFQDLLYQTVRAAGAKVTATTVAPAPLEVGLGVRPVATTAELSQGDMKETSRPLDLAIDGIGYFAVRQASGEIGYTRDGNLQMTADGELVTNDGDPLEPSITIPQGAMLIQVGKDGTVSVLNEGDTELQQVGQIELATFVNPGGLRSLGGNLMASTAASGEASVVAPGESGTGHITQGFLEGSNVDVVREFVDMILAQRGYEAISKVLRSADEMYSTINNATR